MPRHERTVVRWQAKQLSYLVEYVHQELGISRKGKRKPVRNPRFYYPVLCETCDYRAQFAFAVDALASLTTEHRNHRTYVYEAEPRDRYSEPTRREVRRRQLIAAIREGINAGKSHGEISETLGVSVWTVKRRLAEIEQNRGPLAIK